MHEEEIIKQLKDENERLKRENEFLKERIAKLEARLAKYENDHTPPSLRRGRKRKKEHDVIAGLKLSNYGRIKLSTSR